LILKRSNRITSKIIGNTFILIFLLISIPSFQSCKKENIYYDLRFTETPKVKQYELSEISFKLDGDTVKLKEGDYRSIRLYIGAFKQANSVEQLHTGKGLDTFVTMTDRVNKIPFEVKFDEIGIHVLDGFIEDKIFLNSNDKSGNARVITKEIRVIKKVDVTK